ncbi:MAG: YbjN domain-containing protein [Sedimentisphaerales bacterium]
MKTLTEFVKYICDYNDINIEPLSSCTGFKFRIAGENSIFVGGIDIDEKQGTIGVFTYLPVKVSKDARHKMAELVARINEIIRFGNFELHLETGIICYKTSIIFGNAPASREIIEHLLFANWFSADEFLPAIAKVLFGKTTPQRAVESILQTEESPCKSEETPTSSVSIRRNYGDSVGGSLN